MKNETRKTHIKSLKAKKKALKRRGTRSYVDIYNFLKPYRYMIESCVIEEPIRNAISTNIDSIFANAVSLGVYTSILNCLGIEYKLLSPSEWHEKLGFYDIPKGLDTKQRREMIKQISIEKCQELFPNSIDFILPKGHRKIDDNICESILLSMC